MLSLKLKNRALPLINFDCSERNKTMQFFQEATVISTITQARHQTWLAIPQDPNRKQREAWLLCAHTEPINGDIPVGGRECPASDKNC